MKNLIFTLSIIILSTFTAQGVPCTIPLDTIREKSNKNSIFEAETVEFSNLLATEAFVEEPSKKMTMNNLKSLPSDYSGYKLEIARVYYKPLEDNDAIFVMNEMIMIEKINDNTYTYLIGEFKSEKAAKKFIENSKNNHKYTLVRYKNGLRVNL